MASIQVVYNSMHLLKKNIESFVDSVTEIDSRLGFFQQTFDLSGQELRELTCKEPRLITRNLQSIKVIQFSLYMQ